MTVAFHIPLWLLWVLGVPVGALVLACLLVGAYFIFTGGPKVWPG